MMAAYNHYGYNSLKNDQTNKRLRTDYDRESRTNSSVSSYEDGRRKSAETQPNHILLLTITKVTYPINTDVIHTISKDHGNVLRIVIFRKRGVQAMVEYEEVDQAVRAKQLMDGADIYQGCCTLRVEYAKPSKLNVYKNDSETWDYTTPNPNEKKTAPLLPDPPRAPLISTRPTFPRFDFECRGGLLSTPHDLPNNNYGESYPATPGRCVLMVYGLDPEKANCNRLFNLFCLYGNVVKVKFLKSKEGCAMVQMDNEMSVDRCMDNLNKLTLINCNVLQLQVSKQMFLSDIMVPYDLPDGTPSFKDYSNSKNNRFHSNSNGKNRRQNPSSVLHFFNAPPNISEDDLSQTISKALKDVDLQMVIKMFPPKGTEARSSSGLIEFTEMAIAVEVVMVVNHWPIKCESSKFPYLLRLCFSSLPKGIANAELAE
ncbi:heterogeneous nuclear ribonucleoprotein L-like [Sipha flava]|uniref:Heterogeneous nuclear ribonucleoprotein L-like n=1 Tax=Sipha flava TaxID=143950 RepID=A0A8B8GRZ6_9HEMI|nr:heterogeneous nuclear ribonucleoprotein L-like [Sipha flava]